MSQMLVHFIHFIHEICNFSRGQKGGGVEGVFSGDSSGHLGWLLRVGGLGLF